MSADLSNPLWVVTPYFNPAGTRRRLENYRIFRRHLRAPLLAVELAGPGGRQLQRDDADILIRLDGEPFVWQKERLINLGVAALPAHARFVAWVDCDVVFENPDWTRLAAHELEREGGLLHLFRRAVHLPQHIAPFSTPDELAAIPPLIAEHSLGHAASQGQGVQALRACYDPASRRSYGNTSATGMALAARRDTLEACGLYDAAIIGGGDSMLMCAALGQLDQEFMRRQANPFERAAIAKWAGEARQAGLFNRFRHVEQTVYHLWHGDLSNRKYGKRHQVTSALGFDPATHLRRAANGAWEWTDPHSAIAQGVRDYFLGRAEDECGSDMEITVRL